jgi:hypothetical protein
MQPEPVPTSAICKPSELADGESIEGDFDDVLGFGAGNQDVGRDFEFEAPEFLFAGEMLRGLPLRAAHNQRKEARSISGRDFFFRVRVNPGTVAAEDVEQQQLRREREGGDVCFAQLG